MPIKKAKEKAVDSTLETSLNSDLVEQGFKNIKGEVLTSDDSDEESDDSEE